MKVELTKWNEIDKHYIESRDVDILDSLPAFEYKYSFIEFNDNNKILCLAHYITDEDLDLYKNKDAVLEKYKHETPIECNVLDNKIIYIFFINYLGFSSDDEGKTYNYIEAKYSLVEMWDVSDSDAFKVLQMADIPDNGLPEEILEQLLSESTEVLL